MSTETNNKQNTQPQIQYVAVSPEMFTQQNNHDDEIDLRELWNVIWQGKLVIIAVTAFFAIASVIYAINQPNIYKASVLLAPAQSGGGGGLSALAGQFGGLASMAGINLGDGGMDKTTLALEILKSRSFIEAFIEKHDLLVPLMASKGWDKETGRLIINKNIYDEDRNVWVGKFQDSEQNQPTSWQSYKKFSDLLSVSTHNDSSMVSVNLLFYSPDLAKQWLSNLVVDINEVVRSNEQREAENAVKYLSQKIKETNVSSMHAVFYQIIEEQTKNIMLTRIMSEYVLKTIDSVNTPDEGSRGSIIVSILLGGLAGVTLSVMFLYVRVFIKTSKIKL